MQTPLDGLSANQLVEQYIGTAYENVKLVAENTENVNATAANASNINTLATKVADIEAVADISASVTTVAGISNEVVALSGAASIISAIASITDAVVAVAANNDDLSAYQDLINNFTSLHIPLNSDILTTDYTGIDSLYTDGGTTLNDGLGTHWIATGVTTIGKASTAEGWRDAVFDLVGNEYKRKEPFAIILLGSGQSNMQGSSEVRNGIRAATGTSELIEPGVFTWDYNNKVFEVPVWGSTPLTGDGSNNAAISCANELKRQTGRDVYVLINASGGKSIGKWVDTGITSEFWANEGSGGTAFSVLSQIEQSGVERIDLTLWLQGEQDKNQSVDGYNTASLYLAGLNTLLNQFRALPETKGNWQFITGGIGEWYGHTGPDRNDVLLTLSNNTDVDTSNISTSGTTYSPDEGVASSHFSYASLELIGKRFAHKYLNKTTGDVSTLANSNNLLGYVLPHSATLSSGGTENIDASNIKGGGYVNLSNNTSVNLPEPFRYDGATLIFNVLTVSVNSPILINLPDGGTVYMEGEVSLGSSINLYCEGLWEFIAVSNKLYLKSRPKIIKTPGALAIQDTQRDLDFNQVNGSTWRCDGGVVGLPLADTITGAEITVIAYAATNTGSSVVMTGGATNKFIGPNGFLDDIPLATAGKFVVLRAMNTRWAVITTNVAL